MQLAERASQHERGGGRNAIEFQDIHIAIDINSSFQSCLNTPRRLLNRPLYTPVHKRVLRGVSGQAQVGELLAIMGESGCM